MDTDASHSIIRSDLIAKEVRPLPGAILKTATGEDSQVVGEVTCKVTVGNMTVLHSFIVSQIVDEVIIGVDFLMDQGIKIDLNENIMEYKNIEVPLSIGYNSTHRS
ncbi:unnamed protein product [Ceratitis capitata]|uniref:(Mediterranean fruit fly) hypothetical protein n=1 Tax=Ceratitis capitata TaxID=7213 RepID=A0A811UPZ3_CERCA|nr:unnamed protein product [Ceratitis capitata]